MTAPACYHAGNDLPRHIEQALDVGVDHLFPVLRVVLVKLRQASAQTRVVDQHVDLDPGFGQRGERSFHRGPFSHIQHEAVNGRRTSLRQLTL